MPVTPPPELGSAFWGLVMALITAATGCVVALGVAGVRIISKRAERREELDRRHAELAQLELDEKIRARQKAAALDAAAIAQETSYGRAEPLSGKAKAQLAADKLRELAPDLAQADRSTVADLVKLGAAQLRSQTPSAPASLPPGAFLVTRSQAPPPDIVRGVVWPDDEPPTRPPPRPKPLKGER